MREVRAAAQLRTIPLCWESELQDEKQSLGLLSACPGTCLHCRTGMTGTQLKGLVLAVLVQVSDRS